MSRFSDPTSLSFRVPLSDGNSMPALGLGTWRSPLGKVEAAVEIALLNGYRALDCAYTYDNEAEVGAGLQAALSKSSNLKRGDIFITSKIWNNRHLPVDCIEATNESIHKLQCDGYLDLLLIHWPMAFKKILNNKFAENEQKNDRFYEYAATPQQLWESMESLVDAGKVHSLGVSNHKIEEIEEILSYAKHKPVTNQVEAHPYFNQREMRDWCKKHGMVMTAYSPLGNLSRDENDKKNSPLNDPVIAELAKIHNKTPAQIIIRWHIQNGHMVIPKSVTDSRIIENSLVFDWSLTEEEMKQIDELGKKKVRFINPPFLPNMTKVFPIESSQQPQKL